MAKKGKKVSKVDKIDVDMAVNRTENGIFLRDGLGKPMKSYWEPKKWRPMYNNILYEYVKGLPISTIAKNQKITANSAYRIIHSKRFQQKVEELLTTKKQKFNTLIDRLDIEKQFVLERMIRIFNNTDDEELAINLGKWFLERFPEFSPRIVQQQAFSQTNVYQLSKEEMDKHNAVIEEIKGFTNLIDKNNPYVEESVNKSDIKEGEVMDKVEDSR